MATPDLAGLLQALFAGDRGLLAMAKTSRAAARVATPETCWAQARMATLARGVIHPCGKPAQEHRS
jgi:hypothetical protein